MARYVLLNLSAGRKPGDILDDLYDAAIIASLPEMGGVLITLPNAALEEAAEFARAAYARGSGDAEPAGIMAAAAAVALGGGGGTSNDITNLSSVPGATVTDALDSLLAGSTSLATGAALADANATITVAQRYVLPVATLTTDRSLTITPPAQVGAAFLIEVGTQGAGFDFMIVNGGPLAGTLYTVLAGTRFAIWAVSDGTDMIISAIMPLGAEPS